MRFLLFVLLLSSSVSAQGIQAWKLEDGRVFKAEILESDPLNGVITFLVPQRVLISQLDAASRERIIEYAGRLPHVANGDFPGLYTSLPNCTVAQWKEASPRDRRQHIAYLSIQMMLPKEIKQADLIKSSAVVYETIEKVIQEDALEDDVFISRAMTAVLKKFQADEVKRQNRILEDRAMRGDYENDKILESLGF